nr:hypothetical protein [Tanacetum cinerariifolium]
MVDEDLDQLFKVTKNVDTDEFMDEIINKQEDLGTRIEPIINKESSKVKKSADIMAVVRTRDHEDHHDVDARPEGESSSGTQEQLDEFDALMLTAHKLWKDFSKIRVSLVKAWILDLDFRLDLRVLEMLKKYNKDVKYGYADPSPSDADSEYLQFYEEYIEDRLKHYDQIRR